MPEHGPFELHSSKLAALKMSGLRFYRYSSVVRSMRRSALTGYWPLFEPSGAVAGDWSANSMPGTYVNTTLMQDGIGDGRGAPSFDGVTSYVDMYSASLAAAFGYMEGTISVWARVANAGVWTDAATRWIINFAVNSSNLVRIGRDGTNNLISFRYRANGTTQLINNIAINTTDWFHVALTWSRTANLVTAYTNGSLTGTVSGTMQNWVGLLAADQTCMGAQNTTPAFVWSGYIAHAAHWNRPLQAKEITRLARR